MSFGFSAGDFIAGANLAYKLIRALSETQGATIEYQEAMQELGCIQQTFLHVGQMHASNLLCQATLNAISHIVQSSREVMVRFLDKTEKYRRSLSRNGIGRSLAQDSWRKIGWSLFKKHELVDLKHTLRTRLVAINILVSTATYRNQHEPSETGESEPVKIDNHISRASPPTKTASNETSPQKEAADKEHPRDSQGSEDLAPSAETSKEDFQTIGNMNDMESGTSKADPDSRRKLVEEAAFKTLVELGMLESPRLSPFLKEKGKEINYNDEPIKFVDAIGRRYSFPFQMCKTWQEMSGFIKQAFVHVDGMRSQVDEGLYDLVDSNGAIILRQFWEDLLEPGCEVTMRMWTESQVQDMGTPGGTLEETVETLENMQEVPNESPRVSSKTLKAVSEETTEDSTDDMPRGESGEALDDSPEETLEEPFDSGSESVAELIAKEGPMEDSDQVPLKPIEAEPGAAPEDGIQSHSSTSDDNK